ncbi:MAG: DUF3841 domain-containing protein, partial [Clostridia bacterium]|nr:DUF3841 domain-containing protein [Clostridia bacterium]
MTLWTVQPATALDEIRETGRFVCDRSRSFNLTKPDHLDAPYQWLIRQMEERIGPRPDGVEYPIWGWHTWEFEHRAPDPDSAAFLTRTEDKAFFTLELPEDQVVLTDFDAWHLIMMDLFIPDPAMTEDEEDAFLERYTSLPPAE